MRVLVVALAGAYFLLAVAVWYGQTKIIFHPGKVVDVTPAGSLFAYLPLRLIVTERFDSIAKIGSIDRPKLFLQGAADPMLPARMARQLYDAATDPKQLAIIPEGGHEDSAVVNPTAYFAALNGFLSQYHFKPVGGAAR